jgi:hypothetical protein
MEEEETPAPGKDVRDSGEVSYFFNLGNIS